MNSSGGLLPPFAQKTTSWSFLMNPKSYPDHFFGALRRLQTENWRWRCLKSNLAQMSGKK